MRRGSENRSHAFGRLVGHHARNLRQQEERGPLASARGSLSYSRIRRSAEASWVLAQMFPQAWLWGASWNLHPLRDELRPRQLGLAAWQTPALACHHMVPVRRTA